jgi:dihydroceramidase
MLDIPNVGTNICTISADCLHRHLMTGLGAYCYIVWGIWLRHCLNGRQDEYQLVWPHLFSLPEIVYVKSRIASNGSIPNGPRKKIA